MRGLVVTIPAGSATGSITLSERAYPCLVGARWALGASAEYAGIYRLEDGNAKLHESYTTQTQQRFSIGIRPDLGGLLLTYDLGWAPGSPTSFTLYVE